MISYGFNTLGCPDYSVDQVIETAVANGYRGVELRFIRGTVDLAGLPEFSMRRIGETRRKFEDAGIAIAGLGTGLKMVSLDAQARASMMEAARVDIAIAASLDTPYLRVFGGPIPLDQDAERTRDAIAEGLGAIGDLSARSGVTTLLETHDDFSLSASILDLYRRGMSERVGVLWDTLHSYRNGESAPALWAALGQRIRLVHVKDAHVATPLAFDFALTGEGSIPIRSFIRLLDAEGYDGFVSFEWEKGWHREIAEPEIALPHFMRWVRAGEG